MVRLDLAKMIMVTALINCYSSLSYIYLCGTTLNLDEVVPLKLLMVVKIALSYELWTSLMDLCWIIFLFKDH